MNGCTAIFRTTDKAIRDLTPAAMASTLCIIFVLCLLAMELGSSAPCSSLQVGQYVGLALPHCLLFLSTVLGCLSCFCM